MRHKMNMLRNRRQAGYSLVEVTMALLVVAIGLTATFALFPEGLKTTRAAVSDTEVAQFAEYVFNTMDLTAGNIHGQGGAWEIEDTDDFKSPALARKDKVSDQSKFQLEEGKIATFYWIPDFYGLYSGDFHDTKFDSDDFEDAEFWTTAFTYELTLGETTFKNIPRATKSQMSTYAVLKVWPGEYVKGAKPKDEDARVFYREIVPIR